VVIVIDHGQAHEYQSTIAARYTHPLALGMQEMSITQA